MRFVSIFLLLILCSVSVFGTSITLLAANEDESSGSLATATVETIPGSGRVFIETNLLSESDTQHSIRMAKQIVCSDYVSNCDDFDFYYTIKTNSPIIQGPSGGAAIAIVTFAHLNNLDVPEDISLSGTINSGGFIGTVGGLKAKITAASQSGIDTVYIPIGNRFYTDYDYNESRNLTEINLSDAHKEDLIEFGNFLGIEVKEAGSIDVILTDLYGISFEYPESSTPEYYNTLMGEVATDLCFTANELDESYMNVSGVNRLLNLSDYALNNSLYYSAASFCFGANILLREHIFNMQDFNTSIEDTRTIIAQAENSQKYIYETINDIQIYAVVEERILDAKEALDDAIQTNNSDRLAYAHERAQTALSWQTFYQSPSSDFVGGDESLSRACSLTIEEAEQRIQYVRFYLPIELEASDSLEKAKDQQQFGDYPLCIFYSLQAKAQADSIASVFGTTQDEIDRLLNVKEQIATKYVAKQTTDTNFPIIGYSYLEYGQSLKESDPYAALLYFQLAQELSSLDLFLDASSDSSFTYNSSMKLTRIDYFLFGIALGLLFSGLVYRISNRTSSEKK